MVLQKWLVLNYP